MLPLRDLQRRFLAALTPETAGGEPGPRRPPLDPALLAVVDGGGSLTPADRLAIYADMYRTRLVDVLREDFPRVCAVAGDAAFQALACRYLVRHPSTHPSVRHAGSRFAGFLAAEAEPDLPFLADLARLEWARVEVFDAPDATPLQLADLHALPPRDWPSLRFAVVPACRIIEAAWPVHDIWAGAAPEEALRAGSPVAVEPAATVVRVWREGWSVSHAAMGETEQRALSLLGRGEPFAALCAAVDDLDEDAAAVEMGRLLLRWLEDGLLARPSARSC
jgi:hypothetical protein